MHCVFCQCGAQSQVLARLWPHGPAEPVGGGPWFTHGQLEAPNCLGQPTLARPQGFLAGALCFLPVRGPKLGPGQAVAPWPSPAWGGPGPTYQRASKSPQPPQLANVGPGAGIFGKCTAFFSLFSFVLSCQVKNSWASPDFSTCVAPLTPQRAAGSCELPPGAKNGCCTCIFQPCMGRFAPP